MLVWPPHYIIIIVVVIIIIIIITIIRLLSFRPTVGANQRPSKYDDYVWNYKLVTTDLVQLHRGLYHGMKHGPTINKNCIIYMATIIL